MIFSPFFLLGKIIAHKNQNFGLNKTLPQNATNFGALLLKKITPMALKLHKWRISCHIWSHWTQESH